MIDQHKKRAADLWAAAQLAAEAVGMVSNYVTMTLSMEEPREVLFEFAAISAGHYQPCKYDDGSLIETVSACVPGTSLWVCVNTPRCWLSAATAFAIGLGQSVDMTLLEDSVRVQLDEALGAKRLEAA